MAPVWPMTAKAGFSDGAMVLPLDRPVPRLILRTAPEHENRLIVGDQMIDLTRWPATPLEILSPDCKED